MKPKYDWAVCACVYRPFVHTNQTLLAIVVWNAAVLRTSALLAACRPAFGHFGVTPERIHATYLCQ